MVDVWFDRVEHVPAEGYSEVAEFTNDDCYSWRTTKVFQYDGRLFVNTQWGCSCYGWETPLVGDLVEIPDLAAMERYYRDEVTCDVDWFTVRDVMYGLGLR